MEEQQILQKINLDFARAGIPPRVFAKQGDNNMRVVAVSLYNDGKAYKVPGGYAVNVSAKKPDGKSVYNPATEVAGNVAYITLTQQMLAVRGIVSAEIEVVRGADTLKTEKWQINVEECANPENQIESTDAAKVEGYAKAAQYLIGYNEKNILTVFLYEE